jgi:hypothetical protein
LLLKGKNAVHKCGEFYCQICKTTGSSDDHHCFIPITKPIEITEGHFIFYDIETFKDKNNNHVPNLLIAQYTDGTEFRFPPDNVRMTLKYDVIKSFMHWLLQDDHNGFTCLAHNGKAFDAQFILSYFIENNLKVSVIKRGTQLLNMRYPKLNLVFRDTLLFIPGSLSSLPKSLGLPPNIAAKFDFPHRANNPSNWERVIPFPDLDQYMIEKRDLKSRKEFAAMHALEKQEKKGRFNFRKEIVSYCSNDVTVLRLCAMKFREQFISATKIDPFTKVTISAACRAYFTTYLMRENTIAMISANGFNPNRKTSLEATEWFEYLNNRGADIEHGRNGSERKVGNFFIDGVNAETGTFYEYNGCVMHGCPKCTNPEDRTPFQQISMAEAFEKTEKRRKYLEDNGFNVVTMWSHDWLRLKKEDGDTAEFVASLNLKPALAPYETFYGGRTNASILEYECKPGEKIHHLDVVSLYPTVNQKDPYPVGVPKIILSNFEDVENYFGMVKCRVLCPAEDLFPVLPIKLDGKLIFTLCMKCAVDKSQDFCRHNENQRALEGSWCTPELHFAMDNGYKILEVHEVWHWENQETGLFKEYINTFLKEKIEASGYPEDCKTEEERETFVRRVEEMEGITLDREKIEKNTGRKSISKLCLVNFWGKWGQNDGYSQTELIFDPKKYYDILNSESKEVSDVHVLTENCVMVTYAAREGYNEGNGTSNLAIASFTTSHARLRLLTMMRKLGSRLIYYDTDSVIYVSRPGDWEPERSSFLGGWDSQLEPGESHIVRFVSLGPKVYSYETDTGRIEMKCKGLSQNAYTEDILEWKETEKRFSKTGNKMDPQLFRNLLKNPEKNQTVFYPDSLKRDGKSQRINSFTAMKSLRLVYDKRVLLPDFTTRPYGTRLV